MYILRKIARVGLYAMFMLVFTWVSGQLFLEEQTNKLMASVKDVFESDVTQKAQLQELRVIYPDEPVTLEPTLADPSTRQRLINIYEPLVRMDRDLNLRPALAVSWGLIDEKTWEFRLRPDVLFHDGTVFDSKDADYSFKRAMNYKGSELMGVLNSIKEIEIVDELTIRIKTYKPDPLLLQRLSLVLILPFEQEKFDAPVGTGSYRFVDWTFGENLLLKRFENYWGPRAKFAVAEMIVEPDKSKRVAGFVNGEAEVLDFVPLDAAEYVKTQGFPLSEIPSLEVQFLMFNFKSEIFKNKNKRQIFSLAIDTEQLVKAVGGDYARTISQFVSNGIFGFNPDIAPHVYDLAKAKKMAANAGFKGQTVTFHLPKTLELLGEHVRTQLNKIGVDVIVSYMEMDKLIESINAGDADVYFIGFKSELGDSTDFLDVMVHSKGSFNIANYKNPKVDKLIDDSLVQMVPERRLKNLKDVMKVAVSEDVIGVPLFEYEKLFAFDGDKLDLQPRIDGLLYFDELNLN